MSNFESDGKKYKLRSLTADELSEADLLYSSIYSKALKKGIMTNSEMIKTLIGKSQWSDKEEEDIDNLRSKISELEEKIIKTKALTKKKQLSRELKTSRGVLNILQSKKINMLHNTTESLAEIEKIKWITFRSLLHEDDTSVFETYDEFVNSEKPVIFTALRYVMYKNSGLNPELAYPEDKILQDAGEMNKEGYLIDKNNKLINELGDFIDKGYRFVDKDGFLIDESNRFVNENNNVVSESDKVKGVF